MAFIPFVCNDMKLLRAAACVIATLGLVAACTPAEQTASDVGIVVNSGVFVAASGKAVRAEYRSDDRPGPGRGESVSLTFADGTRKRLPLAISASGARYAAGNEEWWEHQGEATYSVNDQPVFVGRRQLLPPP